MSRGKMTLYIPMARLPIDYEKMTVEYYRGSFKDFKRIDKSEHDSWKHFLTVTRLCSSMESGLVSIYRTSKKGIYAMKTYYDGCFHPFICYTHLTDKVIKAIEDVRVFVNPKNK